MTIAVIVLAVALFWALFALAALWLYTEPPEVAEVPEPQWVACEQVARYMVRFFGWPPNPAETESRIRDRAESEGMAFGHVSFANMGTVAISDADATRLVKLFAADKAAADEHTEAAKQRALQAGAVAVTTLRPSTGKAEVW
jgi:hypothetical protein